MCEHRYMTWERKKKKGITKGYDDVLHDLIERKGRGKKKKKKKRRPTPVSGTSWHDLLNATFTIPLHDLHKSIEKRKGVSHLLEYRGSTPEQGRTKDSDYYEIKRKERKNLWTLTFSIEHRQNGHMLSSLWSTYLYVHTFAKRHSQTLNKYIYIKRRNARCNNEIVYDTNM